MPIYKLDIAPTQSGYAVQRGVNFAQIQTEAGNTRIRRNRKNAEHIVSLQWTVDKNGYDALQAFYRLWELQEPIIQHFEMDLILDFAQLLSYRCWFTSPPNLSSVQGNAYSVSAQIRCRPKSSNVDQDELIILGVLELTNPLEVLVNKKLPDALEGLI